VGRALAAPTTRVHLNLAAGRKKEQLLESSAEQTTPSRI
jgi:hypothetical protein